MSPLRPVARPDRRLGGTGSVRGYAAVFGRPTLPAM